MASRTPTQTENVDAELTTLIQGVFNNSSAGYGTLRIKEMQGNK